MKRIPAAAGLLAAAATILVAGCGVTGVSRQQEISAGQQAAAQINRQYRTYQNPEVTRIGMRLAAVSLRPDYPYTFRVIDDKSVNAFALPGGPIYVTSGMMNFVQGHTNQLAAVLAHEIVHVAHRHAAEQMQRQAWVGVGIAVLTGGSQTAQTAATLAANLEELGYSRNQEREADHWGTVYLIRAGYDPYGMVRLLERLNAESKSSNVAPFFSNHPGGAERVRLVEDEIRSGQAARQAADRTSG